MSAAGPPPCERCAELTRNLKRLHRELLETAGLHGVLQEHEVKLLSACVRLIKFLFFFSRHWLFLLTRGPAGTRPCRS